jgi:hypothetical protein
MTAPYRPLHVDAEDAIAAKAEGPRERWHARIEHCLRMAEAETNQYRRDQWLAAAGFLRMAR